MSRAAQIYDFTLAAGGSFEILAEGSYYRILSATGSIEVRRDGGSRLAPMLPGQGERDEFQRLTLRDLSGAPNTGFIIVADGTFIDDRITGEVSVIDGEKARTIAGGNYMAAMFSAAVAAQHSHAQLWNPSSNTRIVVNQLDVTSSVAQQIGVSRHNAALTSVSAGTIINKLLSSAAVGMGQSRFQSNATIIPTIVGKRVNVQANQTILYPLRGPIVIPPGWGLTIWGYTVNADVTANADVFEELI